MASVYAARTANAVLMARKIEDLIKRGFEVRDRDGYAVERIIFDKDDAGFTEIRYVAKGYPNCQTCIFNGDPNRDDGAHDTVGDFNRWFDQWKAIHPRNILKLTEVKLAEPTQIN